MDTEERIERFGARDPGLVELLFHYGRYLLISSSRPGTQAANLQGIWNASTRPPWSSNWTLNINAQMNYWPAEVCNLAECHQPLLELIRSLSVNGAETAAVHYGTRAGPFITIRISGPIPHRSAITGTAILPGRFGKWVESG